MAIKKIRVDGAAKMKNGEKRKIEQDDTEILLLKVDGELYAHYPYCTHYGAPLENGLLNGRRLVCPWHHACFDACTGQHLEAPGMDALPTYEVALEGDDAIIHVPEEAGDRIPNPMHRRNEKDQQIYVVLGGGAAGAYAAEGMRQAGYEGRIVMITADEDLPYDRPNCSKAYLSGEAPEAWMPLRSGDFYDEHGIEVWTGRRVTRVSVHRKEIEFEGHDDLSYDKIVLCTGGAPRHLLMPGMGLKNVHTLRSLADSRQIREAAGEAGKVVIVGASFIGMESAASLLNHDCEVTVIAPGKIPFARVFGEEIGSLLRRMHEEQGVRFRMERSVEGLKGSNGKVMAVTLDNGEDLPADLVLVGIGVEPNTGYLKGVTLEKDGGIRTDEFLHVRHDLYAAGDIAHFPFNGGIARIEHWALACQQGRIAGMNMAGAEQAFQTVPFFWTRQHGKSLGYIGHAEEWDRIIFDGDVEQQKFLAFYVKDNQVKAVAGMGRGELNAIQELMRQNRMPAPAEIEAGHINWKARVQEQLA